ncbi:uncharacterized protein LACBIDRAFT_331154 [Laccaria bicolor S238N-H82]|uniref:Predicted protein n=1 Tax=Laccaria bicolor (strain S238N-H82 / ATCC MYA-4686) TaxID=486041 RepID=B0DNL6_LACBS|nr:uncharacterized protein LACBIDRAFT_331154 [Laccaria bicolor S238N-H82]EDR03680.1 predicted protein [Laccaria bicolor S238N-H82]|eukprot:XP_001885533.1 predicted protein [Laccaria bicolor S238N-H82]
METQSKGHLCQRSLELEAVEIQRRKVIARALGFIARISECIASDSFPLYAPVSISLRYTDYLLPVLILPCDHSLSLPNLFALPPICTTRLSYSLVTTLHMNRRYSTIVLVSQHQCNLQLVIAPSFAHHHDSHNLATCTPSCVRYNKYQAREFGLRQLTYIDRLIGCAQRVVVWLLSSSTEAQSCSITFSSTTHCGPWRSRVKQRLESMPVDLCLALTSGYS